MWERWDGWTPEHGFQDDGMNSFNHYAFGSVGQYLFAMVGGIQPDAPGYTKIRIEPVLQPGLTWAAATYDSIQGRISCRWRRAANKLILDVEIPFNTTATVKFGGTRQIVGSGSHHFVNNSATSG
jgi:alpha-L-rhamnosidase